ncbi:hypothetical protein D0869_08825 [Hortaea werneckii]|uniref:DNA-directed RNA polymerase I subunit RPA34.5 n=1 Tax=Hortaea werneckii TaxID=91943 RepID=A0A3M6WJQ6_HORWE|nr:hypothetical protein KC324_g17930 [Hortaea werneckii]RMX78767.1 hypothetical protein D0869_08825 [Hortaea werneckii]RMX98870.1 hypothetical protein D0868_09850 [Hortaea werneckii]
MAKTKEKKAKASKDKSASEHNGKQPNATQPAQAKSAHLSQEYVADSGDEDAPAESSRVKKVNSEPASQAQKMETAKASTESSSESSEEDDSESEEELAKDPVQSKTKQDKAKTNGVKRKSDESSSSDKESEEEAEEQRQPKKAKTDSQPLPNSRPESAAQQPPSEIAAQPFQPPSGYNPVSTSNSASGAPLSKQSLRGKQIWHITAPSDVPLSSITEVASDAIQSARTVVSHGGAEYMLSEDNLGMENNFVMLPGQEGYKPVQQRLERTLHLQQKITLPKLSNLQASETTGSAAAGDVAEAAVSTTRPQPKGLRMRYKPSGYGAGEPGMIGASDSDSEEHKSSAAKKGFQFPKSLGAHGNSEHATEEGRIKQHAEAESGKKSKKKRKEKQPVDPIADTVMKDDEAGKTNAGAEAGHEGGVTETAAMTPAQKVVAPEAAESAAGKDGASKDEKARRKEEKRKKKEAKAKDTAA